MLSLGSRRRFTAFWDLALVSKQTRLSTMPYHIATWCGYPLGPFVASVATRLSTRNCWIWASVMTIWARWLGMAALSVRLWGTNFGARSAASRGVVGSRPLSCAAAKFGQGTAD